MLQGRAGDRQDEVLAFLMEVLTPAPERIDTHGAIVLLSGERAYKLKRAVRFSFMDFSTLEKREAALRAELRLNRRTAPQLYRRVLSVTRKPDGSLALTEQGEPVEWLLEMTRFPADAQLNRIAVRGELGPGLIEALAIEIFAFHTRTEVRTDKGGLPGMREVVEGNGSDLLSLVPAMLDEAAVRALNEASRRELQARAALLEARRDAGRVRHCHGDLHLANIVLLDDRPVLFDCIEFSEDFACIDVLYDLAFLIMDLIERGFSELAQVLLQTYNDQALDDVGLTLLPFLISVRAAVRAKVAGFNARVLEGEAQADKRREAGTYLALAQEALQPAPPRLVVIGGRSGTGKSTVARSLAPSLGAMPGAMVLRSDVIRKRLFGKTPTERLPAETYTPEVSARVFATIAERARVLLKAGRTVIADGVYGQAAERHRIEQVARELGVPFHAVWLDAAGHVLETRVASRRDDASDADIAVVRRQTETIDLDAVAWPRVDAGRPIEAVVQVVREVLRASDG